jgi:hypothetical protein
MPSITRAGLTLSEALLEAAETAPADRAILICFELWHESMSEPLRFVDNAEDLVATLEDDAPRDAATEVVFTACEVDDHDALQESDAAAVPTLTLTRNDVAGIVKALLDAARGSLAPWTLIQRIYASDDTTSPALLPVLTLEAETVTLSGGSVILTASYGNFSTRAVPRSTFRRSQYPGLQR